MADHTARRRGTCRAPWQSPPGPTVSETRPREKHYGNSMGSASKMESRTTVTAWKPRDKFLLALRQPAPPRFRASTQLRNGGQRGTVLQLAIALGTSGKQESVTTTPTAAQKNFARVSPLATALRCLY